jgi:hypothetical protein
LTKTSRHFRQQKRADVNEYFFTLNDIISIILIHLSKLSSHISLIYSGQHILQEEQQQTPSQSREISKTVLTSSDRHIFKP